MIGEVKMHQGQRYVCSGFRPHTKRDGSATTLAVWQSHCAECGELFEFTAPTRTLRPFMPNRRCADHKRPGRRFRYNQNAARA